MTQRNAYNVRPVDMAEPPNSLVLYGHTFDTIMNPSGLNLLNNQDQAIYGSFGHSLIQGESSNLHDSTNLDRISDSYPLGIRQTESSIPWDQLCTVPNQQNMAQGYGHYMEGMPLSAASFSTMLAARGMPGSANSIDDSNSSTQTSLIWGHHDNVSTSRGTSKHETMERTGLESFGSMLTIDPHGWMTSQDTNFRPDCTGLPVLNQELSLSLATANPTCIQNQYSEMCCSSSQYNGCLSSEQTPCSKNQSWRFSNFGSTYVQALQEILAALASYSIGNFDQINYPTNYGGAEDHANPSFSLVDSDDALDEEHSNTVQRVPGGRGSALERKKKCLLALLQAVDKQYNQYQDEIHTVVSAFHSVTELNPHIHARFALQTISRLYRSLRERISNHILAMGPNFGSEPTRMEKSFESSFIQRQWAIQQVRQRDNHLFRPQRGLPERSVSVLRAWMFQNFLHPYPKDAEKHLLAVKSGLSRSQVNQIYLLQIVSGSSPTTDMTIHSVIGEDPLLFRSHGVTHLHEVSMLVSLMNQVSNWFINARVRIWKPMIDEMYAEMNRRSRQNDEETNENQTSHVTLDNQRYAHY